MTLAKFQHFFVSYSTSSEATHHQTSWIHDSTWYYDTWIFVAPLEQGNWVLKPFFITHPLVITVPPIVLVVHNYLYKRCPVFFSWKKQVKMGLPNEQLSRLLRLRHSRVDDLDAGNLAHWALRTLLVLPVLFRSSTRGQSWNARNESNTILMTTQSLQTTNTKLNICHPQVRIHHCHQYSKSWLNIYLA